MLNRIVSDNSTHRVVTTGVQVLAYMSTPDTRFLVQMRNPSDRLVSVLKAFLKVLGTGHNPQKSWPFPPNNFTFYQSWIVQPI